MIISFIYTQVSRYIELSFFSWRFFHLFGKESDKERGKNKDLPITAIWFQQPRLCQTKAKSLDLHLNSLGRWNRPKVFGMCFHYEVKSHKGLSITTLQQESQPTDHAPIQQKCCSYTKLENKYMYILIPKWIFRETCYIH